MKRFALDCFARLALAFFSAMVLGSCGSGAVSGPAPVNDPTRITILPATATLYSGAPTTFVISGGTGSYIVSSSNQAVIPVSGSVTTGTLILVPNPVIADTPVTLTVRDTGTTPLATATLTVRPGTVNNELTIIPTSTQGGNCAPAVCSGSDAIVSARISQAGIPLPGRGVRFTVVSGDFRFVTSAAGAAVETTDTSITVVTDEAGRAQARIRALPGAQNQTALLQVTDLVSGAFQRTAFAIAQSTGTSPGFFAAPESLVFTGPRQGECANNASGDIFIFGGTPPYRVSNASSGFIVSRDVLAFSGDSFTVTARGVCVAEPGLPIVVTDSAGRTVTVRVANVPGTAEVPPLVVAPATVTLSSCSSVASVSVAGGTGNYIATSGGGGVMVNQDNGTFSIQRVPNSPPTSSPVTVGFSDGRTAASVNVVLTGSALGACPEPAFRADPVTVTLDDCEGAAQVTLSGGSGTYSAASNNTGITATLVERVVSIARTKPSGMFSSGTVTVSDGSRTLTIDVTATAGSPAAGSCS